MTKANYVSYHLRPDGYAVAVYDAESQPIKEYSAGNSYFCSQTYLPPRHPQALRRRTLRKFARQTANEMAAEFGLEKGRVFYSEDDEKDAAENYAQTRRK